MSKGNASVNLRELERWGAVRKVPVRGDRKLFYEANLDIVGILRARLREGLSRRFEEADRAIKSIESAIESNNGGDDSARIIKERLEKIRQTEDSVKMLIQTFL
jgi:DNA-binding transcriptional regulator GbsR (MarR family)